MSDTPAYDPELIRKIIGWDVKNWSQILPYWENLCSLEFENSECLEIGAGYNGGMSLWLAMMGARVICSDLRGVRKEARDLHGQYPFQGTISYEAIDAQAIPYDQAFDVIVFKSVLGGIGRMGELRVQQSVVEQMYGALKPGGTLLFAENLTATWLHMLYRKYFGAGRWSWGYTTLEEFLSLFESFTDMQYRTTGCIGAMGFTRRQQNLLGWVDRMVFNHLLPERLRYIVFGYAVK